MSEHTPGPWSMSEDGEVYSETLHQSICMVLLGGEGWYSNGPLITAAPDLLAAVRELMDQPTMNPLDMTPDQRAKLWSAHASCRAAIAKASP